MSDKHYTYSEELNSAISFALHKLLFIPLCCMHRIAAGLKPNGLLFKAQHRPICETYTDPVGELRMIHPTDTSVIPDQPHICRSCHEDILSRGHSGQAHRRVMAGNTSFHNWLSNDEPMMDLYQDIPHSSGFEQNMPGLKDAHLERVEQYWFDHQLARCVEHK